ncbi:hypothetical protein VTO42DRAFT_1452 [Malbranchea cinnamomea]
MAAAPSAASFEPSPSTSSAGARSSVRQTHVGATNTSQRHRQVLSSFTSSPGSSLRQDEDVVVVEVGSRWLRAGFEGDSNPLCVVGFGREEGRRVGDYRGWIQSDKGSLPNQRAENVDEWANGHELWSVDIRGLDIGLVEDKIERAFREIYNKYLLTDAGSSRLVLVLPSIVPYPLLSALLSTLFHRWRYPSITLLPSAAMAAVAAGVRSALVVDIGWEETTITAIYEYREVKAKRSTRAMKLLMKRTGLFLSDLIRQRGSTSIKQQGEGVLISFEMCEEIMTRMSWCRDCRLSLGNNESTPFEDNKVTIPIPVGQRTTYTDVPFSKFADVVEDSLFVGDRELRDWDDEDMPLDVLAYNTLLSLSPDVRGSCMSRIVFVGGGSNIPGIRQRIMNDIDGLIKRYGWNVARGRAVDEMVERQRTRKTSNQFQDEDSPRSQSDCKVDNLSQELPDPIEERIRLKAENESKPYVHGTLRQVESLGSWAGASLVTNLKVRGLVEVDRDKFLQHGLAGASREADVHTRLERRSGYGPGMVRSGGDRSSWTLGEWG